MEISYDFFNSPLPLPLPQRTTHVRKNTHIKEAANPSTDPSAICSTPTKRTIPIHGQSKKINTTCIASGSCQHCPLASNAQIRE